MLGCFTHNTKSNGNNTVIDRPNWWPKVKDAITCQAKFCQEYDECKYFVYNKKTKSCTLKVEEAVDARSVSEDHIFGPQYCPGKSKLFNHTNKIT